MIRQFARLSRRSFSNTKRYLAPKTKWNLMFCASMGVGYMIYRKFLQATMINNNLLVNQDQFLELKLKNLTQKDQHIIPGHLVNVYTQNSQKEVVVVIGAGLTGVTQALKLLESGYTVILIDREKLPANLSQEYTDALMYPKSILSGKFVQLITSLFKKNADTQIYLNWNTVFEKYWFIWSINSFIMNFFQKNDDQDNLVKRNLDEINRIKNAHPQINFPSSRSQVRLFKTEEELKEYEEFLTRINIPFQRNQKPNEEIQQEFIGGLTLDNNVCFENKSTTQNIISYCRQMYQNRFFEFYNSNVRQLVLNPDNHVIGVNTTQGVILSDYIIFCAAHRTKYLTDLLGYRVPLLPLREWSISPKTFSVSHDIFFPSVNCVNNKLSGQYEIGMDRDINNQNENEADGAYLRNQFTRLTNIEIDKYEIRNFLRVITPDSKPIISKVQKFPNVFVNVGHDHGFGAASAIEELMKGNQDWDNFRLDRYYLI